MSDMIEMARVFCWICSKFREEMSYFNSLANLIISRKSRTVGLTGTDKFDNENSISVDEVYEKESKLSKDSKLVELKRGGI